MLCATRGDWQICGEAADGEHAVTEILNAAPDVVVLDLSLPGEMNGFDVATQIRRVAPMTKIVLFSLHDVPVTAREVGADAFVSKSSGVAQLLATIDRLTAPGPIH